jgi:hypothetical protein
MTCADPPAKNPFSVLIAQIPLLRLARLYRATRPRYRTILIFARNCTKELHDRQQGDGADAATS